MRLYLEKHPIRFDLGSYVGRLSFCFSRSLVLFYDCVVFFVLSSVRVRAEDN